MSTYPPCRCGGRLDVQMLDEATAVGTCPHGCTPRRLHLTASDAGPYLLRRPTGSVRLGLMVRADNRGLGNQTWELYRHLNPHRTLVVAMGRTTAYTEHLDRYPDARVADGSKDGHLDEDDIAWLLSGIDVLLCAETPYDFRVWTWARQAGVRTVLQANPELYPYELDPALPRPDVVLNPSGWLMDRMPGAVHLPHPVDRERLPFQRRERALTFLHVAGHRAMADRAGTQLVIQAMRHVRSKVRIVIRTQSELQVRVPTVQRPEGPAVQVRHGDVVDYPQIYASADVLIAPRRYGGQSLPVNEAHSLGMPVIALDREPESGWGGVLRVPSQPGRQIRTKGGVITTTACSGTDLAKAIDRLASEPDLVAALSDQADERARSISWDALRPRYEALFASLAAEGTERCA